MQIPHHTTKPARAQKNKTLLMSTTNNKYINKTCIRIPIWRQKVSKKRKTNKQTSLLQCKLKIQKENIYAI